MSRIELLRNAPPNHRLAHLMDAYAAWEGITQGQAADRLGLPRSTVARYCRAGEGVPCRRHSAVARAFAATAGVRVEDVERFCEWQPPHDLRLLQLVATDSATIRDRNPLKLAEKLASMWRDKLVTIVAPVIIPQFVLSSRLRTQIASWQIKRGINGGVVRRSARMHGFLAPHFWPANNKLDRFEIIVPGSVRRDLDVATGAFGDCSPSALAEFQDHFNEDLINSCGLRVITLPDSPAAQAVLNHFADASIVVFIHDVGVWTEHADHKRIRFLCQAPGWVGVDLLKWDRQVIELARSMSHQNAEDVAEPATDLKGICALAA